MMCSLYESLRARRQLKRGWKLQRAGDLDALSALADEHRDTALHKPLQAMLAKAIAEDDDRPGALKAFNELYASLKGSEDPDHRYLKLYALYHLALIRNSIPDAAYCARKARALPKIGPLRGFLPIPTLVAPPEPGPAITAMM